MCHGLLASRAGAQGHAEHVGADLAAHTLRFQLLRQVQEDLIGQVCHRRAQATRRAQLREQHGDLPHGGVNQEGSVHAEVAPAGDRLALGASCIVPELYPR